MKKITAIILVLLSGFLLTNCNKDDDNMRSSANSIIGTWKLIEEYTDGTAVSLNSCSLQENYIFGAEQFTHETYSNSSRRFETFSDDDSDDEGGDDNSDDEDDDSSDDHGDDGSTDDTSDDVSDDNDDNPGGGECLMQAQKIGFWTAQDNRYTLTIDGVSEILTIQFTDANNRFHYEKTVMVNGVARVKRYVFQRQ